MLKKITDILRNQMAGNAYKIVEQKIESAELFFIKKELDMNRSKKVHHFDVTVYKDFAENGVQYKGSATTKIYPTLTETEIRTALDEAALAAGFVKNKYYPLVKPAVLKGAVQESMFAQKKLTEWLPELTISLFQADTNDRGGLNSAELFLNQIQTRIVTSEGIDLTRENYRGELEFIVNWKEESEEVELYKEIFFADFDPSLLTGNVARMLTYSKEKALATATPALKKQTVLLTGEPVRELLNFYYVQSAAQSVYEETSTISPGELIQGQDVKGDLVTLRLDPFLNNSTRSTPFDQEGWPLETVTIFEAGKLMRYWGDNRYSYYLNVAPTGNIGNLVFGGGTRSLQKSKENPYLELVAFSDFQLDSLTGDFAGEIRLGWYFDGSKTVPVTGGSISGNIKEVQQEMYFSQELQQENNFVGPQTIQLFNVSVAGQD